MNTDIKETGFAGAATAMLAGAAEELAQLVGGPVSFSVSETPLPPAGKGVAADVVFAGPFNGNSHLILTTPAAAALAKVSDDVDLADADTVASLGEVVAQFSAGAAKALTEALGEPATLTAGELSPSEPLPPPPDAAVIEIVASVADQSDLAMSWELDSAVAGELADKWPAASTEGPATAPPPPAAASAPSSVASPVRSSGVIDSVELDVAVELGNVALTIGELLHLGEGSVVTLTQTVGDEVVMLANGTPVASGEVVVVDGTLGFRVSQLITDTRGA
ncbi:MAG: FliM/FliN family flagellar motor switch protein [bacterium]|nr:FliM/FliN family flagellar motor switch protein [bacterium]